MLISSDSAEPIAGQSYNLTCSVQGAENLNSNMTYQWIKNETFGITESSSTLSFSPIRLSDAGFYMCKVTVSSDYLDDKLFANNSIQRNVRSKPILSLTCVHTSSLFLVIIL